MFNLHSEDIAYIFNLPKRRKDQFFIRVTYIDEIGNIVDSFYYFISFLSMSPPFLRKLS